MGLLAGTGLRWFGLAAGGLLLSFGVAMMLALGVKAPLDFSVFAASAGAFLLAARIRIVADAPCNDDGQSAEPDSVLRGFDIDGPGRRRGE
ncbi:MAG: hypothetical protein ACODAA_00500 [Gemmatimonadota bacterium]